MKDPVHWPAILLVEPQFVLRRTVVAVAHDLGIARFEEAVSVESARSLLAAKRFDGIVIDVHGVPGAFGLLSQLRQGAFACDSETTVIALTSAKEDSELDDTLRSLRTTSIVRKPFKLAELFQIVSGVPAGAAAVSG